MTTYCRHKMAPSICPLCAFEAGYQAAIDDADGRRYGQEYMRDKFKERVAELEKKWAGDRRQLQKWIEANSGTLSTIKEL